MKTLILVPLIVFSLFAGGCTNSELDARQQMFDSQKQSIESIEHEIQKIRDGNGGDMSKWSADTIILYKKWQEELAIRYQEREKLIKVLSGNTMSETTH